MSPHYYYLNNNGHFLSGKWFTTIPTIGNMIRLPEGWYEIVGIRPSIDVIMVAARY